MLFYAVVVTFLFGMLMGSCATIIAALRMEKCCPFCTGPIISRDEVLTPADQKAAYDILDYDQA